MNLHEIFLASQLTGGEKETDFVLIEKIEVNETGIVKFERTKEPDGTSYNFKKAMVIVKVPIANFNMAGKILVNKELTHVAHWNNEMLSLNSVSVSFMKAVVDSGYMDCFGLNGNSESTRTERVTRIDTMLSEISSITALTIQVDSISAYYPVGTQITIYAVRK